MQLIDKWISALSNASKKSKIDNVSRFFKTNKGEYSESDIFVGITVPENRSIAKNFINADFSTIEKLLDSPIHEYRLSALLALVEKFKKAKDSSSQKEIVDFYLCHTQSVNNWDLVDLSAPKILGEYLKDKPKDLLLQLSHDTNFWVQRIAIVSTWTIIKTGDIETTLKIAESYLNHKEPLIHKATGWMLRETGKIDIERLKNFLELHASQMPRVMLSYAIEKMNDEDKKHYRTL